jgi:undecaprenyl-diphosphatase
MLAVDAHATATVRLLANDYFVTTLQALTLLGLAVTNHAHAERLRSTVFNPLIAVLLVNGLTAAANHVFYRSRPFRYDSEIAVLVYHPSDSSFPANSSAVAFALAACAAGGDRRVGRVAFGLAAAFSAARVAAGMHYPSDVLVGAALGLACARLAAGRLRYVVDIAFSKAWPALLKVGLLTT